MKPTLIAAGLGLMITTPLLAQPMPGGMQEKIAAPLTRGAVEADVKARFAAMDANKDGVVTPEEAAAAREAMRKAMADKMFGMMDVNKDGMVSRAEFDAHLASMGGPGHEKMGDGKATDAKMDGGMMHHPMPAHEDRMFEMADTNKDGKVTLAEANAAALSSFDKVDANKDGSITPEERRAAMPKLRGAKQDPHAGH